MQTINQQPSTIRGEAHGHIDGLVEVHVDEFAKAEGAISCKGVIFGASETI